MRHLREDECEDAYSDAYAANTEVPTIEMEVPGPELPLFDGEEGTLTLEEYRAWRERAA